jgi:hypothetical protein
LDRPSARVLPVGHCHPNVPFGSDAQSASLRPLSRNLRAFPARPAHLGGRAPHARNDGIGLAGACPHLATGRSFPPDDYVVPRHAYGLATRARRPRPSEETTSRVISGPSPQGLLSWANPPWRGGLRTAANGTLLVSGDCSIRPPGASATLEWRLVSIPKSFSTSPLSPSALLQML